MTNKNKVVTPEMTSTNFTLEDFPEADQDWEDKFQLKPISQKEKEQLLPQINLVREKIAECLTVRTQLGAYDFVHPYITETLVKLQLIFNQLNGLYNETEQRPVK